MTQAVSYQKWQNLPEMFFEKAQALQDKGFLFAKREGRFSGISWLQAADQTRAMAGFLSTMGIQKGDRVVLVSENRPEWLIADFAIMSIGAITVPAYTTNTVEDHKHILQDSGARAVIVSNAALAEKVLSAASQLPAGSGGKLVAVMIDNEAASSLPCHGWDEALRLGRQNAIDVKPHYAALKRQDTACIIYTSGTGGNPKGVMQSHGALLHNCRGAYDLLLGLGLSQERFLSFLPLSHAYEHTAGQMFPISIGAEIFYAEGADKLAVNLIEARPTIMTAVPRLYESFYQRIMQGVKRNPPVKRWLFNQALHFGKKNYLRPCDMGIGCKLWNKVLNFLVRRKVRARFGGRLKAMVSGGAPLNQDVGVFFTALGLTILQGYGQTETAPIVSCNVPEKNKIHTVGRPLTATEVKIAEDGEILVRGELVMNGYWNNPEATRAAMQDGYVLTGDIGIIDEDGCLIITDRKKDIIVLSGGDTLSPQRVEGFLCLEPEIGQAAVFGDKQSYLAALIVPRAEFLAGLFDQSPQNVQKAIQLAVERANQKLSLTEKLRRFAILDEGFSVDNGLMTPTMKVRRGKVKERYGDLIAGLF